MSYNVTRVECLALDAKIHARTLQRLLKRVRTHEGDGKAPSDNFLAHHERAEADADGFVKLKSLAWTDDWSGYALELFETILTEIEGTAEIVLTWEGGDSFSGYRVHDGVVEKCPVIRALGGPIKRVLRGIDLPPWSPRGTDMIRGWVWARARLFLRHPARPLEWPELDRLVLEALGCVGVES